MIKFTGKETLQEYYFKMSLNELDNQLDESKIKIVIDTIFVVIIYTFVMVTYPEPLRPLAVLL